MRAPRFILIVSLAFIFLPAFAHAADTPGCYCNYTFNQGSISLQDSINLAEIDQNVTSAECASACTTWIQTKNDEGSDPNAFILNTSNYITPEASATQAKTEAESAAKLLSPQLSIPIPGINLSAPFEEGGFIKVRFLGDYISGFYRYALGIGAFFAIVMIMVGGAQYIIGSATGGEAVTSAKKRITNAITGLTLIMSAYLILYIVNPNLTSFNSLSIQHITVVPFENIIEPSDANSTTTTCVGQDCYGASSYQDCMLNTYGKSDAEVKSQLVDVTLSHNGQTRTYRVHQKAQAAFQKAFDDIEFLDTSYDITSDTAGGTQNWRATRGQPKYLSNHSWGTAIDLNPSTNPYCAYSCYDGDPATACSLCVESPQCKEQCAGPNEGIGDLPDDIVQAFKKAGFNWLGDTNAAKGKLRDYMHFDFNTGC